MYSKFKLTFYELSCIMLTLILIAVIGALIGGTEIGLRNEFER
jgi:hypothetical protein